MFGAKSHFLAILLALVACVQLGESSDQLAMAMIKLSLEHLSKEAQIFGENSIFSPTCLMTAMSMAFEGTDGLSRIAVHDAFKLRNDRDVHMWRKKLQQVMSDDSGRLKSGNLVVVPKHFAVEREFEGHINHSYNAAVYAHNFRTEPELAIKTINEYVAKRTENKITDLLPPDSITIRTKLVLVNYVLFKSLWLEDFVEIDRPMKFHGTLGTNPVQMMFSVVVVQYQRFAEHEMQVFALPFKNRRYSMVIALPDEGSNVRNTMSGLADNMDLILNPSLLRQAVMVNITMPPFEVKQKMEATKLLTSRRTFPELRILFDDGADFGRINKTLGRELAIDNVHHQATITVDKFGVEAAAATAVSITLLSAVFPEFDIIVDRPFVFFIVDMEEHLPHFVGTVNNL